jgi:hypothetical protein
VSLINWELLRVIKSAGNVGIKKRSKGIYWLYTFR